MEAQRMHQKGIQIFAVGISSEVSLNLTNLVFVWPFVFKFCPEYYIIIISTPNMNTVYI